MILAEDNQSFHRMLFEWERELRLNEMFHVAMIIQSLPNGRSMQEMFARVGFACEFYMTAREFLRDMNAWHPGVILFQWTQADLTTEQFLEAIKSRGLQRKLVAVVNPGEIPNIVHLMKQGLFDVVAASDLESEGHKSVKAAYRSHYQLDANEKRSARSDFELRRARLTSRQCQILDLICAGHSSAAIAQKLGVSPKHVSQIRSTIYERMRVSDAVELLRKWKAWHVGTPSIEMVNQSE